jgi:hypothetical protein
MTRPAERLDVGAALARLRDGDTLSSVAADMGVTPAAIHYHQSRAGVVGHRTRTATTRRRFQADLANPALSDAEILRRVLTAAQTDDTLCQVTATTIARWRRGAK